jgi:hypothetical protein
MGGREQRSEQLWSFPNGMLGPDDSIKDFEVEANDGHTGKVSWASYAPGESYLVISHLHHLHEVHHVVPAAAVEKISTANRKVWLRLSRAQVEEAPEHHDPPAPLDYSLVDALRSATSSWGLGGDMF